MKDDPSGLKNRIKELEAALARTVEELAESHREFRHTFVDPSMGMMTFSSCLAQARKAEDGRDRFPKVQSIRSQHSQGGAPGAKASVGPAKPHL